MSAERFASLQNSVNPNPLASGGLKDSVSEIHILQPWACPELLGKEVCDTWAEGFSIRLTCSRPALPLQTLACETKPTSHMPTASKRDCRTNSSNPVPPPAP